MIGLDRRGAAAAFAMPLGGDVEWAFGAAAGTADCDVCADHADTANLQIGPSPRRTDAGAVSSRSQREHRTCSEPLEWTQPVGWCWSVVITDCLVSAGLVVARPSPFLGGDTITTADRKQCELHTRCGGLGSGLAINIVVRKELKPAWRGLRRQRRRSCRNSRRESVCRCFLLPRASAGRACAKTLREYRCGCCD